MSNLWVDNKHPNYGIEAFQRQFTRDQFTGEALLVAQDEAASMIDPAPSAGAERVESPFMDIGRVPGRKRLSTVKVDLSGDKRIRASYNGTYLKRRSLGESADAFRERASITRFPSHMPALIETYVGGIKAVESEAKRVYGEPLGDPKETDSVFYRMWHDIDGTGRNWPSAMSGAMTGLIVDDTVWAFVELGSSDYPRVHLIDPQRIVDWHDDDGIPVWLLMYEERLVRTDFHEPAEIVETYTEYGVDGWKRWRLQDNEGDRALILEAEEAWKHPFYSTPEKKRKRLPFVRQRLSDVMGRYVGYQMAMDHNMLYNLLSDARWNFRVINHPRLRLEEGNRDQFEEAMNLIAAGANGLLGKWSYISPDAANGAEAYKVYVDESKQFYVTNHQRMNSSNIERSATEIAYDEATGRVSFLAIMTDRIDEFENDVMFLASQILKPNNPEMWLNSRVERSRSFRPIDIQSLAQQQATSMAALASVLPAEMAADIAKNGISDETINRIKALGDDAIVTVEQ